MSEDLHLRLEPDSDRPVRVSAYLGAEQGRVEGHAVALSEVDVDIEIEGAESLFSPEMTIEAVEMTLPGEGTCRMAGVVRFVASRRCKIAFLNIGAGEVQSIRRYIQQRKAVEGLRLRTYRPAAEIHAGLVQTGYRAGAKGTDQAVAAGRRRILIVDDSHAVQSRYREILTAHDFEVIQATDGLAAIRKSLESLPDLILMDLNMPKLNGIETTRIIKGNPKTSHIPICMFTSEDERDSVIRAIKIGVKDYIIKSLDEESLVKRIRQVLGDKD